MPNKLELHNVAISTTSISLESDDAGLIPPNLAKLTETILKMHAANGDLMWVSDVIVEIEKSSKDLLDLKGLTPHTLVCIANGLSQAHEDAQDNDSDEIIAIARQFNAIASEIETLMGREWLVGHVIALKS